MIRRALVLLPLLLAGCASTGFEGAAQPQQPADPYILLGAAQGAIQATEAARIARELDATQEAARAANRTENEIALLMAPLQASQTAISISNEQAAAANIAAIATATAGVQLAAATDQAARATSTQRVANLTIEQMQYSLERQKASAAIYDKVLPIIILAIVFFLGCILVIFTWRLTDWTIEWIDRRLQIRENDQRITIYDRQLQTWRQLPRLQRPSPVITEHGRVFEQVTQSVNRSSIGPKGKDMRALAHDLVLDAIDILGKDAKEIPSCAVLKKHGKDWNDESRDDAVNALEATDAVHAETGKGTFLTEKFMDLEELEADLFDGLLNIPTPTPSAAGA